jgi:hypothetical protein
MSPLLPILKREAVARGLLPGDRPLTDEAVYSLVRDMPYERASSREPRVTIEEWRGTCSGKHYLLRALFEELGYPSVLIAATHEFTAENAPWLPEPLRRELEAGPVPDVHNFLRIQPFPHTDRADEWMTVDATWPLRARRLGLPANERFEPGRDQVIAADPIEVFHVPEDEDPQAFKERLIAVHAAGQQERRDAFIRGLSEWLTRELGAARA